MFVVSKLRYNREMGLFFGKKKGRNTLVLDISSGSTSAAIVCTHTQDVPEIITRVRTPYFVRGEPNGENLEKAMLTSLRTTLEFVLAQAPILKSRGLESRIDKGLVTLSSPWADSYLKTVHVEKEKAFIFDMEALIQTINNERDSFQKKLKENFEEEGEIFESAVMDLYLNGYSAPSPTREKVKEVEISFILSATTKDFLSKIEAEIAKSLAIRNGIVFHSFLFAFYKVLSHSFRNLHSALLINMTSEITDILFLRHGKSAINASLPFGPATIARSVAERLRIPLEIAYSYLALFAEGSLDKATTDSVDAIIVEREDQWRALWSNFGQRIQDETDVPYSIFLVVRSSFGRLMETFLQSVFPNRNIIVVGDTNTFTKELVRGDTENMGDEKILILSSFSNILN